jgi:hypothetical protein
MLLNRMPDMPFSNFTRTITRRPKIINFMECENVAVEPHVNRFKNLAGESIHDN